MQYNPRQSKTTVETVIDQYNARHNTPRGSTRQYAAKLRTTDQHTHDSVQSCDRMFQVTVKTTMGQCNAMPNNTGRYDGTHNPRTHSETHNTAQYNPRQAKITSKTTSGQYNARRSYTGQYNAIHNQINSSQGKNSQYSAIQCQTITQMAVETTTQQHSARRNTIRGTTRHCTVKETTTY